MTKIDDAFYHMGHFDTLADQNTPVHRLDPRAKVLTTMVFIGIVISFGKYEVASLLPYFLYPFILLSMGNLPLGFFIKNLVIISPFILFVGILNPFYDREIIVHFGSIGISGGWISFLSIILRCVLTVGASLVLIATTGFPAVCMALERLGCPRVFTVQLLLLYRYLFVLVDEGARISRAHSLRSFNNSGIQLKIFARIAGNLLLRTIDRAQRIHTSMLCRGFDGEIRIIRSSRFGLTEMIFTISGCTFFIFLRFYDVTHLTGTFFLEIFG